MALLVHLPLTGDLHNQGLAEVTYTGTPVFKTTGKIGNSAFDLSHRVTFNCPSLDGIKTFSIAFWGKVNSDTNLSTNWVDVISFTDRKSDGSVTGVFRWETCYGDTNYTNWGISVHDNGYYNISDLAGIPQATGKNIWHHIVITVDLENNEVKEYLNGVLVGTATCNGGSLTGAFHLGENNLINGEIQDVRVYSHCLSQKKISELKKALVLHFCLDGNNGTLATPNLVHNSNKFRVGAHASGVTPSVEEDGTYKVIAESGNSNWNTFWWYEMTGIEDEFEEDDDYTVSFWIKSSDATSTTPPKIYLKSGMGYFSMNGKVTSNYSQVYYTGKWKKENSLSPHLGWSGLVGTYYISRWKLEKGSIPTPWCPNSSDALYTALGYDDGIEYDTSGYGNNGIKNNSPTYSIDSPRYLASTHLDGINQTIQLPNLLTLIPDSIFTFNIWFKRLESELGSKAWETIFGGPSGFELETCSANNVHDNKIKAYSWGNGSFEFEFDKWNMLTMVSNGTNTLFYLNGELKLTGTYKSLVSGSYFIGSWKNTSSQNYRGYVSDAKVFATALSAEEIQKLYTVSASIDSNGNAYSNAFVE